MEKNLNQKLYSLQQELGAISKDETNPFYKSKYFDINSLIKQLQPLLKKHGLLLLQPIENNEVKSIILDVDGETKVESGITLPDLPDPQKLGSAITYFRRYTLQSLLALQAEDDDGNKAITKVKPLLIDGTPEFKNALKGMSNGATVNDIKKVYRVTKEIEVKLLNFKID